MNFRTEPALRSKAEADHMREAQYGPRPVNIFTTLRKQKGYTYEDLSVRAHVGKQAQIRNEQGTFIRPLPSMLDYWVGQGVSELTIVDAYEDFRDRVRERYSLLFGDTLDVDTNSEVHPLRQLRLPLDLNCTELSKYLCIPQATLAHFERKFATQQSVPKELQLALEAIGYSRILVARFMMDYKEWRAKNTRSLRLVQ